MVVIMIGGCSSQAIRSVVDSSETCGDVVVAGAWLFVVISAAKLCKFVIQFLTNISCCRISQDLKMHNPSQILC